jgi:hypothetical protein
MILPYTAARRYPKLLCGGREATKVPHATGERSPIRPLRPYTGGVPFPVGLLASLPHRTCPRKGRCAPRTVAPLGAPRTGEVIGSQVRREGRLRACGIRQGKAATTVPRPEPDGGGSRRSASSGDRAGDAGWAGAAGRRAPAPWCATLHDIRTLGGSSRPIPFWHAALGCG